MRHLRIESLSRKTHAGVVEELAFDDGLNFVVGPPNAGKSQWIRMLDYLFADSEPFLNRFPGENFTHYDSIAAIARIGPEVFRLERFMHLDGMKTKVAVDGKALDLKSFQHWLLDKLDYPLVRYPKGMSSLEQTWPELSFRTLYRHIYRQQRFWTDLADRQTAVETSACLLQFLGLAAEVYNEDLEQLRDLREQADRHAVELYACRMALALLADENPADMPKAEDLSALNPEAVVSDLRSDLSALEEVLAEDPANRTGDHPFDRTTLDRLIGKARRAGERAERLRFAETLGNWSARAESRLKERQREIWEKAETIRAVDLSATIKERTDFLCAAMNEYLSAMNELRPGLWKHSDVRIRISRRNDLRLCIGNMQWDRALGGSDGLLFLMAYHYGLLSLSAEDGYRYPGLVVLDFPAYFRGQAISEIEGLVARPFADLLQRDAFSSCQVIFLGSSFEGEDRCRRIPLETGYLH